MADRSSDILKRLQSEVTCPLCLDVFTEPKKLPCDHVYCRACLHGLALRSIDGTINCPECRQDIPIPSNGVADFPTLHQVNRLLDVYQDSLEMSKSEVSSPPPQLKSPGVEFFATLGPTCETHSSQPLALFCETCKKLVCRDCALTFCAKRSHEHGFIDDMMKKYEEELSTAMEPLQKQCHKLKGALKSVTTSKQEVLSAKDTKVQQINETFQALFEILEKERNYFIDCAEKTFQERHNLYSTKESELGQEIAKLETVIQSIEEAHKGGSKSDFLSSVANNKTAISQAAKPFHKLSLVPLVLPEKEMEICSLYDFKEFCHEKNFHYVKSDSLKFHIERDLDFNSTVVREMKEVPLYLSPQGIKTSMFRKLNLTAHLVCLHDNSTERVGIKKVSNEKYLLSVLPQKQGKHTLHIKHSDMHICGSPIPFFVAIHPHQHRSLSSKDMFTSDLAFYKGHIYAANQLDKIHIIDPATLTIQDSINVFSNKLPVKVNRIVISDLYIYATDSANHRVIKIDTKGSIVRATGTLGVGPGQFNLPCGLRFNKHQELYICDSQNSRIQVFSANLKLLSMIASFKSSQMPVDVGFDEEENIYVADKNSGIIRVLTPQGQFVRKIGSSRGTSSPVSTSLIVRNNLVYLTDAANFRVMVFQTTGELAAKFGEESPLFFSPESITIDDNNFVYVSDGNRIIKF